jgi:hypothetical protein
MTMLVDEGEHERIRENDTPDDLPLTADVSATDLVENLR